MCPSLAATHTVFSATPRAAIRQGQAAGDARQPLTASTAIKTTRIVSHSHGPIAIAHASRLSGGLYSPSSRANPTMIIGHPRKRVAVNPRSEPPVISPTVSAIAAGASNPSTWVPSQLLPVSRGRATQDHPDNRDAKQHDAGEPRHSFPPTF